MNVLLIRPPDPMQNVSLLSHTKPMNLAYLAAYLRRKGIRVQILDYEVLPYSDEALKKILMETTPSLVGVSCMTPTIKKGAGICKAAKQFSKNIMTVVGGPHANALPLETLEEFGSFDFLIYGEGEETLLDLCISIKEDRAWEGIPGLVYRKDGELFKGPRRELIKDIDSIPFPARDLIDFRVQPGHSSRGFSNRIMSTELFTSRGCPIGCMFCAIQATFGKTVRFRDLSYVEEEINQFTKDYHFDHVVIADDTFTLKKERAFALCDILRRAEISSWNCDTRVDTVSKELLLAMKESGCRKVAFGVESGSQRIVDMIGKKITIEQVERAVHWAKEVGIQHIEGNFIIGAHPYESREDVEMTRKLIRSLPWSFVSVSIIVPYPGTRVYTMMKENGMIGDVDWEDFVMFGKPPKWRTQNFSQNELVSLQKSITREFYLDSRYIISRLLSIRSWEHVNYWFSAGISYLKWYLTGRV